MNINTLTIKAQEALQAALSLARERGQQAVEPLHLLSVLVREDDSLAAFLLGRVGVNVRGLREEAERAVDALPRVEGGGDLGVAVVDGGGAHHAVRPLHAPGQMADDHRDAQLPQVEHGGALPLVGAGDLHPRPVEHLRQGRHGYPADAHQMGPLPRL